MKVSKFCLGVVTALVFALPGLASATPLSFSYETGVGGILGGMMQGTVQPGGDTVVVSSVSNVTFNGVAGPDLPSVLNFTGNGPDPLVSFSGSTMDICATVEPCGVDGFVFGNTGNGVVFASGESFGGTTEAFAPERWSLSAVPEPATLALFGMGLIGLGVARRKRRA